MILPYKHEHMIFLTKPMQSHKPFHATTKDKILFRVKANSIGTVDINLKQGRKKKDSEQITLVLVLRNGGKL